MDAIIAAVTVTDVVAGLGTIAGVIALVAVAKMGARRLLGMIK